MADTDLPIPRLTRAKVTAEIARQDLQRVDGALRDLDRTLRDVGPLVAAAEDLTRTFARISPETVLVDGLTEAKMIRVAGGIADLSRALEALDAYHGNVDAWKEIAR